MAMLCALLASGCASSTQAGKSDGLLDSALKVVGLQRAQDPPKEVSLKLPELEKPRKLTLRIHASTVLNTDEQARSLALVTRVYRLKDKAAFLQTPYESFQESTLEKAALRDELIDVKEVLLKPGGKHEVVQTLPPETEYIGIVALFRAPAEQRWRFVFDAKASSQTGITVGAHGCALSVAEGKAVDAPPETLRLAGVQCD